MPKKKHERIRTLGNKIIELPYNVRFADIKALDNVENDILLDLKMNGRRNREYYIRNFGSGGLDAIKRLKSRGFVEAVRSGNYYCYDLTATSIMLMSHGFIG